MPASDYKPSASITVPFHITEDGSVAKTSDPYEVSGDRVKTLVLTSPLERVMLPGYGVPLGSLLFENYSALERGAIGLSIRDAMQEYEPQIEIIQTSIPETLPGDPTIAVTVHFRLTGVDQVHTVTFNGSVVGELSA